MLEEPAFWRDLANRFLEGLKEIPRVRLYAHYREAPAAKHAESLGLAAKFYLDLPAAANIPAETIYDYARQAARVGAMHLGGLQTWGEYDVLYDSRDSQTGRAALMQWRSLAAIAGAASGDSSNSVDAHDGWLNLIRRHSPRSRDVRSHRVVGDDVLEMKGCTLEDLSRASAEVCLILESEAYVRAASSLNHRESEVPTAGPIEAVAEIQPEPQTGLETLGVSSAPNPSPLEANSSHRERVRTFLDRVSRETGNRYTKPDVYKVAGYFKDRKQWTRFLAQDPMNPPTGASEQAFLQTLTFTSAEFERAIARWELRRSSSS